MRVGRGAVAGQRTKLAPALQQGKGEDDAAAGSDWRGSQDAQSRGHRWHRFFHPAYRHFLPVPQCRAGRSVRVGRVVGKQPDKRRFCIEFDPNRGRGVPVVYRLVARLVAVISPGASLSCHFWCC